MRCEDCGYLLTAPGHKITCGGTEPELMAAPAAQPAETPQTKASPVPVDGFVPYIYGATLGRPSAGRPELVLAAGLAPETTVRRFERELGELIGGPSLNPRHALRSQPCGTRAAYRRHLRDGEKACEQCLEAERRYNRGRRAAS